MIRFEQIGERTYKVYRNGELLGYVAEPVVGRGWRRYDGVVSRSPHETRLEWVARIQNVTIGGFRTRTAAVRNLLLARGFSADEYQPTSRRGTRSTARPRPEGRAFGVEIELTGPAAEFIIEGLRANGINVRSSVRSYAATTGNQWELKHDGSVAGHGLELVSPKLYGEAGFAELETVCRVLAEAGATVDRSCGVHVHHDLTGLSAEAIRRQVLAFVERQDLIARLVAPSRRNNHYCPSWTVAQVQQLRDWTGGLNGIGYIGPRGNINLQAYARHGTVEVRWHGGSTSFKKIAAWIRFSRALFALADTARLAHADSAPVLMNQLIGTEGFTVEDSRTLLRFERAAEELETREYTEAVTV